MPSAVTSCPTPPAKDPHAERREKMDTLVNHDKSDPATQKPGKVQGLIRQFEEQGKAQSGPGTAAWDKKDQAIKDQQRGLQKLMDDHRKKGGGDLPPGVAEWATKPAPQPGDWKGPSPAAAAAPPKAGSPGGAGGPASAAIP